jgi:hypothetical protein
MTDEDRYRLASDRAKAARLRLDDAIGIARSRLAPARLKADAKDAAADAVRGLGVKARTTVANHPVTTGALIFGFFAWLFRRPLAALSRRLYVVGRDSYRARRHMEDEE